MSPDEISSTLELSPRRKWSAGEPRKTPKGTLLKGRYESSYCWFPLTVPAGSMIEEGMIDWLRKLEKHEKFFKDISATGGSVEFLIGWFINGNAGEVFSWQTFSKLARLGINLAFDVY